LLKATLVGLFVLAALHGAGAAPLRLASGNFVTCETPNGERYQASEQCMAGDVITAPCILPDGSQLLVGFGRDAAVVDADDRDALQTSLDELMPGLEIVDAITHDWLADEFARQFAGRMGRRVEPLSPAMTARLKAYSWPGNVRELQNVIERAIITARDGQLNLDRALPSTGPAEPAERGAGSGASAGLLTVDDLARIERENLRQALERSAWKVAGEDGAARLLGMAPSTLTSRMKALGLRRAG